MKRIYIFLLLLFPLIIFSETQVTVSLSSTNSTIGEQINLKFIVRTSIDSDSIRISETRQDFEFVKEGKQDIQRGNDLTTFEKNYKISFFKTGDFNVGPFNISLMKGNTAVKDLASNTIPVKIKSVLEESDKDIKPLRDLPEIKGNPFYLIKYLLILLAVIGIIILIIHLLKRRKRREERVESPLSPPDVEFLKTIESLWRTDMLRTGKVKRFFLTLTEAYKLFMTRSYNFNAEDLTTYEIIENLKKNEEDSRIRMNFEQVFLISDLAKFAKYNPSEDEAKHVRQYLMSIIDILRERREKKEEENENAAP